MEKKIILKPIGKVQFDNNNQYLKINKKYIPALKGLEEFSYIKVVWWGHLTDDSENRNYLICEKPYKMGPASLGTFATRSPLRPNPVLISTVSILSIDHKTGIIQINSIDADENTPILDIKPYYPCEDTIRDISLPVWSDHWPKCVEDSYSFDWQDVFSI